jgi:spore coat protein U-like protein
MSGTGANTSTVAYTLKQTSGGANGATRAPTPCPAPAPAPQSLTVYNIPTRLTPQPDAYKSTITATVYF